MQHKSIITRYENNPILKPEDMPAPCCAVYNSGGVMFIAHHFFGDHLRLMFWQHSGLHK